MIWTLAIRVASEGGYMLRVSGKTALGPSGIGGRDGNHYSTVEEVYLDLDTFALGDDVRAAARVALANSDARKRFSDFAENVQIPFEALVRADILLFRWSLRHASARLQGLLHEADAHIPDDSVPGCV